MTPQQHQAARSLLRSVNGGTDIRDWARSITGRAGKGLPVSKQDLKLARELLEISSTIRRK